jgi:lipoprotein NlpI
LLKNRDWPYPIIEFYLGRRSLEGVQKSAVNPDQSCEASFYAKERQLLNGQRDAAISLLRSAADTCPKKFVEYGGALAELQRLENEARR